MNRRGIREFCKRHDLPYADVSPLSPAELLSERDNMRKILYLVRVSQGSETSRAKAFKNDSAIEEASVLSQNLKNAYMPCFEKAGLFFLHLPS